MADLGRVLQLGGAVVNVRSGMRALLSASVGQQCSIARPSALFADAHDRASASFGGTCTLLHANGTNLERRDAKVRIRISHLSRLLGAVSNRPISGQAALTNIRALSHRLD